jgi:hypothetical protein
MWPHRRADPTNPRPVGICDRSGFLVLHETLQMQMEYRGLHLQSLGLMVRPEDYDTPNPQLQSIIIEGPEGFINFARPAYWQQQSQGDGPQLSVLPNYPLAMSIEGTQPFLTSDQGNVLLDDSGVPITGDVT